MLKSTRSYFIERANDASHGAFLGVLFALLFRENRMAVLCLLGVLAVLNVVLSIWNQRVNTYESYKTRIDEKMDALRYRGLLPTISAIGDEDIQRLKAAGEDELAAVIYQTIH